MKKNMLSVILLAALLIAGAVAYAQCNKKSKTSITAQTTHNPSIEAGDTITDFRYECHRVTKDRVKSEVLSLSKSERDTTHYLYCRFMGSWKGTNWYGVDGDSTLRELGSIVRATRLDTLPYTALNDEDKKRSRQMVEAKYASGKVVSVVTYLDGDSGNTGESLAQAVTPLFRALAERAERHEFNCEYSISNYDSKGRLNERIDYLPDGVVRGGYDPDNPLSTF